MATAINGKWGSYNQTVGVPVDMDEAIILLSPSDVPFQSWMSSTPTDQIKVEWLEEELTAQTCAIASLTGTGPYTVTLVTTDFAAPTDLFRVGDILHIKDAAAAVQYTVTSVTSGTVFVLTDFAGNTTDPVAADVLEIIGQYLVEGGDPLEARGVERSTKFNYTQIMQERVEATRTARQRRLYGQGDPYDHELAKKFKEIGIRTEKAMVHGQRAISGDLKQRFMGGALYYITTNTESVAKAASKAGINALLRKCYDQGGSPDVLMVSPSVKAAISDNIDPTLRRWNMTDTTGGSVVDRLLTDFGEIEIEMNRFFPKTKGIALQRGLLERRVMQGYMHEMLAKTGDSDRGEIIAEHTLQVKNEKWMGVLTITDA